ncbi:MAG: thiamine phosphate synthase [Acidimicrobiales bacterium]
MVEAFVTPPAVHPLLANRRLYLCTPDRPDLEAFLSACVAGGVDLVQLRDKHLDAGPLTTRARLAVRVCRDLGVPFIMNDRPDIALEVKADGVHVGQDDVTPAVCRRVLGPNAIVGLSTHAPVELDASTSEPVDYISVGPVAATPTKPGRPGTGLGYVRYAAGVTSQPFFITGGVTPDNIDTLIEAGAQRFVVVRWLTEAPNPMEAASTLRKVIDERLAAV